jgi:hypothetical protein
VEFTGNSHITAVPEIVCCRRPLGSFGERLHIMG